MVVDDMVGARKLPRGAALARAAALASDKISVSGLPRPQDSGFSADRYREQNMRVVNSRLRLFQREMQQVRRGEAGGAKPKTILDPEVDLLLQSLPPLQPVGTVLRMEKFTGLPPRLLGNKLTPLEKEQQVERLSRPSEGLTGSRSAGAPKQAPCALCRHAFAKVNLVTPVTRKAVFAQLDAWGADVIEAFGAASIRLRTAPSCYEVVRVCRFCTQFFDAAVAEADKSELVAEADMTM
jgi:hypothetical protein